MVTRSLRGSRIALAATAGFVCSSVVAQVTPRLVIEPWKEEPHWGDTYDELFFSEKGKTKGTRGDYKIFWWDSLGKVKFPRSERDPVFSVGYRILTLDIDSEFGPISGQLNDVAVAGAWDVGEIVEGWELSIVGGVGTANDGHWSNDDAVYGVFTANVSRALDDRGALHFGIYHDGNQLLWPDVPQPQVAYTRHISDDLQIAVGVPESWATLRLFERLTFELNFQWPLQVDADAFYEIGGGFGLYGRYQRDQDGFFLDERDNRRQFYQADRVEAGVRWITRWFDALAGVGYLLDHRFRQGWDVRDLDTVADLTEEVYVLFVLQGTF